MLSTIASTRVGLPNIISERNNSIVNPPNWFWRKLRNYIYKYASILVVQTEGNKKIFSSIIPSSKIKIIENAVSERLETSFNEINFNKPNLSRLNILTVGRLNENKAHHIGLKALSQLTDYPWHYTVVGNGPLKQKLIGLCNSLGIKNRVTFTGNIKNVEDYYKNSDIFIFTSRSEGFPNALMEAYYFGIPCLSTNCDYGPSDIIQNGIDGFLTPVDDVNLLKNKLKTLIEDKNLRISISKVAQKNSKRFHIENVAKKWETLIKSCTGSQN